MRGCKGRATTRVCPYGEGDCGEGLDGGDGFVREEEADA